MFMDSCYVEGAVVIVEWTDLWRRVSNCFITEKLMGHGCRIEITDSHVGLDLEHQNGLYVRIDNCEVGGRLWLGQCDIAQVTNCRIGTDHERIGVVGYTAGPRNNIFRLEHNEITARKLLIEYAAVLSVQNNTIHFQNVDLEARRPAVVQSWAISENQAFVNNIFYVENGAGVPFFALSDQHGFYPRIQYNCLYGAQYLVERIFEEHPNFSLDSTNMITDPLFQDLRHGDLTLYQDSPCIDTGDPDSPLDPDSTRADIGVHYFHHELRTVNRNEVPQIIDLVSVYPNPFNNLLNVQFMLSEPSPVAINVFDVSGRKVYNSTEIVFNRGVHTQTIAADLPSGQYFISVQIDGESVTIPVNRLK